MSGFTVQAWDLRRDAVGAARQLQIADTGDHVYAVVFDAWKEPEPHRVMRYTPDAAPRRGDIVSDGVHVAFVAVRSSRVERLPLFDIAELLPEEWAA